VVFGLLLAEHETTTNLSANALLVLLISVIAPTSIKSIFDLEGKRIVAQTDVGYYSAKAIFPRLNMHVTYDYWTDDSRAVPKIINGEADAYIGRRDLVI
jgi:hypothetical protein